MLRCASMLFFSVLLHIVMLQASEKYKHPQFSSCKLVVDSGLLSKHGLTVSVMIGSDMVSEADTIREIIEKKGRLRRIYRGKGVSC